MTVLSKKTEVEGAQRRAREAFGSRHDSSLVDSNLVEIRIVQRGLGGIHCHGCHGRPDVIGAKAAILKEAGLLCTLTHAARQVVAELATTNLRGDLPPVEFGTSERSFYG